MAQKMQWEAKNRADRLARYGPVHEIRTKYAGKCADCGQAMPAGTRATYVDGQLRHATLDACAESWLAA